MSESKDSESPAEREGRTAVEGYPKLLLRQPHALIRRTLDLKVEKDQYGYERRPPWPGVDVRVSKAVKRNALIILDRLFKALDMQGIQASVVNDNYNYNANGTFAMRERDKVQVYVLEENEKVPHVPTAKEFREKEEHPALSRIPKFDTVSTGRLKLVPGGVADLSSEGALGKLIANAVAEIVHQLDTERDRRKAAEAESHRKWEREKQEHEEKSRVEALHKAATALRQYREMMEYIQEVRLFGRVPDNQRKEGQTLEEWLRWAEWRARHVHPLD